MLIGGKSIAVLGETKWIDMRSRQPARSIFAGLRFY